MVQLQSLTASRLAIVAGKGGVGKTTVTAALARAAAEHGQRVLVIEMDGRPDLAELVSGGQRHPPLGYDEQVLVDGLGPTGSGRVAARSISAAAALVEYLDDHGMRRISRRLVSSGVVDVVSTAAPGLPDLLVLGKIKQLERAGAADLIVVDGPAAGHAITFLMAAAGLREAISTGPINTQANDVLAMLRDPARCQVILVTIAEETPINETIETAYALEDRVGVQLGPVVVNAFDTEGLALADPDSDPIARALTSSLADHSVLTSITAAARFRRGRAADQAAQVARLTAALPLPQVHLPALFTASLDTDGLGGLTAALLSARVWG